MTSTPEEEAAPVLERWQMWPKAVTASSAAMFMACSAAADLPTALPGFKDGERKPGNAAERGNKWHELLAAAAGLSRPDMKRLIKALEFFSDLRAQGNYKMLIEEKVDCDWLKPGVKTTADLVLYKQGELHILDWKMGTVVVDHNDNSQGKFYGVSYSHLAPKAKGVFFHIVQPFAKTWDPDDCTAYFTAAELDQFKDDAIAAQVEIDSKQLTMSVGDHCMFCPAYPHSRGTKGDTMCPEAMRVLYPERQALRDSLVNSDEEEEEESWFS